MGAIDDQAGPRPARATPGAGLPVVRPADIAEARDALRPGSVAGGGDRLLVRGGGTKLDWGAPGEGVERVIDTTGLTGLVRHDPGDLTATVRAGTALADLQRELAPAGQWLAIDPPLHDRDGRPATVGGVMAANAHGPRRVRYGAMRDLAIGATFALPDGTVARSGGNVIKNVAGYDLVKLLCGSLGTLALVLEVTVRLHPLPAAEATLTAPASTAQARALALALSDAQLEPSAVDHTADLHGDGGRLWLRFEGAAHVADDQARAAAATASAHGLAARAVERDAPDWERLVAGLDGAEGDTVIVIGTAPAAAAEVEASARRAVERAGVAGRWHSHLALGLHRVILSGGGAAEHAQVTAALRADGHPAVLRRRAPEVDRHVGAWPEPTGAVATAVPLMRAIKERLDPGRRLAPGRFLGGI